MNNKKIFVVGNSRSGTTMMGRILGRHEDIFTFHELHFFEQLWTPNEIDSKITIKEGIGLFSKLICIQRDGYLNQCENSRQYLVEAKNNITIPLSKEEVFKKFLEYETAYNNKTLSCDQTPRNLFYTEEILKLYPEAKIIYMIRDPRDILLSQKNKWKRRFLGAKTIPMFEAFRSWVNYHPLTISKLWRASVNTMIPFEQNIAVKKVYFEHLLADPEKSVKEICDFLEIKYMNDMLNIPQIGSSTGLDKPGNKGIDKKKTAGYKKGGLSDAELYICESHLEDSMVYHDYIIEGFKANPVVILWLYFTFPIKLTIALGLNIKRMKNIVETIKRRMK